MQCPNCGGDLEKFRNPVPTVDAIIEIGGKIVLVERRNPPHGWALPGGFVDYGETLEDAVQREAFEETGLQITLKGQFHTYSKPERDPRLHTITTVFLATAEGCPTGGDDALQAAVFDPKDLPTLVFDHRDILNDYYKSK
ncbi:MAG: NUDIX hydrolase [Desulfobulbaceae bacterium]|nr:NUDIX hydrolase [Desulfobulbaceae bacterium]